VKHRALMIGCLVLPLMAACSQTYSNLPVASASTPDKYVLGPGDSIKVAVYGFDQMAGSYVVSDTGTISLPMLSTIDVAGKSPHDLEGSIAGLLRSRDLAPNANVSVQIDKYRPFYILGEVQKPGEYPYVPGMTVLTAVSLGGGYTFRANKKLVAVTRKTGGTNEKARLDADAAVMPGDTIIVPEATF
jgi:polysaccharide biosynthesis/export protein